MDALKWRVIFPEKSILLYENGRRLSSVIPNPKIIAKVLPRYCQGIAKVLPRYCPLPKLVVSCIPVSLVRLIRRSTPRLQPTWPRLGSL